MAFAVLKSEIFALYLLPKSTSDSLTSPCQTGADSECRYACLATDVTVMVRAIFKMKILVLEHIRSARVFCTWDELTDKQKKLPSPISP